MGYDDLYKYYSKLARSKKSSRNALRVTWLGVAGIYLHDSKSGLLIDPFITCVPLWKALLQYLIQRRMYCPSDAGSESILKLEWTRSSPAIRISTIAWIVQSFAKSWIRRW
jgi:hypothetical protein